MYGRSVAAVTITCRRRREAKGKFQTRKGQGKRASLKKKK
jgi:hypothetical protein